jgi:UDPglucose 6-dehydrogenase
MNVLVAGAGFVGLTTAVVLSEQGNLVLIVETDESKRSMLNDGKLPFFEPGLQEAFNSALESKRILIENWESSRDFIPQALLVCVGTPSLSDGSMDLSQVKKVIENSNHYYSNCKHILIKSTVIPGTTRTLQDFCNQFGNDIEIGMIPEFLREGSALKDARYPDRVVLGSNSRIQLQLLEELFSHNKDKFIVTNPYNAEIIKYVANAFLATCISFTNEIFSLFNRDSEFKHDSVLAGWHLDHRLRHGDTAAEVTSYLKPGFGFGGSCFPKDVRALSSVQNSKNIDSSILKSVLHENSRIQDETIEWLQSLFNFDSKILILGIAFKENSDDLRESPALRLFESISRTNKSVYWLDMNIGAENQIDQKRRKLNLNSETFEYIVWTNNDAKLRQTLVESANNTSSIVALRYQSPVPGYKMIYPRMEK